MKHTAGDPKDCPACGRDIRRARASTRALEALTVIEAEFIPDDINLEFQRLESDVRMARKNTGGRYHFAQLGRLRVELHKYVGEPIEIEYLLDLG